MDFRRECVMHVPLCKYDFLYVFNNYYAGRIILLVGAV